MSQAARFSISTLPPLAQWAGLILLAGAAGQLLKLFEMPAAMFLGPMLVAIGLGVSGATIRLPKKVFQLGQGTVGVLIAHAMSASVLLTALKSWPVMLLATILTVMLSAAVGLVLVRFAGIPSNTAAWGTSPGAASAMVAMSEDYGADSRVVATMQYVRVVCVVTIGALVSHFIGATVSGAQAHVSDAVIQNLSLVDLGLSLAVIVVGVVLGSRLPAGALLVPLMLGGALQLSGVMQITIPDWLLPIGYGAIGCYVGLRFDRPTVQYVWRRLPMMVLASLLLIVLCALSAWLIAVMMDKDYLSVYLATSPGGLDTMAIIAIDTHADVGFVLAMQTLRLFGVILTGSFLARQIIRLTDKRIPAL
ncbi:membrane protein [Pseudomonas coronafaciens pv. porri]|uniref:Membrane protein n=1 Tax=Pseudomonas coronafaciens pv. porri TaxID=83964 RepID=A0ABR5JJG1_9PSED|nr:AbrB family transcriptional regulator [Pseudomonas coronafaciens]KOP53914.1 membrane protein [Pseudomonas coronafaciens pv. porri]KOP58222.1 membrane protein [Pseudomonas coronafaciens pv. porri]RMW01497.1 AbrB protein [Pseudomonas coronafaciens pv. porri]RMW07505.1 AbrB protein [Pseudomonas coronafaciens pv. porri]